MPPTYFDLAARDYILADSAIELVIEVVPCSGFIKSSQSSELIFNGRQIGGKFRCDLARTLGVRDERESRPPFDFHASPLQYLVPMIKTKPPRYQTLIERSITARGFGTEKYYVIDSRTNGRIVKCRNQPESEKIAGGLNAAAKFRWVKLLSD